MGNLSEYHFVTLKKLSKFLVCIQKWLEFWLYLHNLHLKHFENFNTSLSVEEEGRTERNKLFVISLPEPTALFFHTAAATERDKVPFPAVQSSWVEMTFSVPEISSHSRSSLHIMTPCNWWDGWIFASGSWPKNHLRITYSHLTTIHCLGMVHA